MTEPRPAHSNQDERPQQVIMSDQSAKDSVVTLAYFMLYSLAMFTLPFLAYFGTKYGVRYYFNVDGFPNTVWSVLSAVVVTNIIIFLYICKGYYDDVLPEVVKQSNKELNSKKEE